jgi:putative SOS response-associated peptidase YedK
MCGRYVLYSEPEVVAAAFKLASVPALTPRFNIAPTQPAPVIRNSSTGRVLALLRWGLVPAWSPHPTSGPQPINARSETVRSKPAFREACRHRRCIVPADGFYEWQPVGRRKQPMLIQIDGGRTFAMAGLWERWTPADPSSDDDTIESFTILTTDANSTLRPIHDRMPVILDEAGVDRWLARDDEPPADLLHPCDDSRVSLFPVSQLVNSPANDSPRCLEPVEPLRADEPDGPTLFSGLG